MRYAKGKDGSKTRENGLDCVVRYHEAWGSARQKLDYLSLANVAEMAFDEVGTNLDWEFTPHVQQDAGYNEFPYLCDIFKGNAVGVVSGADNLLSSPDKERLVEKLDFFFGASFKDGMKDIEYMNHRKERIKGKAYATADIAFADNRDWQIDAALAKGNAIDAKSAIIEWTWRGFDRRSFSYYPLLMKRGTDQYKVMQYLLPNQNNVSLIVNSQSRGKAVGLASSVFITETPIEHMCNEGASGMESYVFPLRINSSEAPNEYGKPKPAIEANVKDAFLESLGFWKLPGTDAAEDVFYYIYGVLFAPTYRKNFAGLLAKDFPRIPFPKNKEFFDLMSRLGRKLAAIHLLKDPETKKLNRWKYDLDAHPAGEISIKIGNYDWISTDGMTGDLWFDTKRTTVRGATITVPAGGAFAIKGVPAAVWEFEIGGIKQIDQWLGSRRFSPEPRKDRLTRGITLEELAYFTRVLNAIVDTIAMRPLLDAAYVRIVNTNIIS
jgi:predicted helicase